MSFQIFQEKLREHKIKNLLIFLGVAIPAIQALIFIQLFGVNIPVWDDYEMGPGFTLFFNGVKFLNNITILEYFSQN